MKTSLFKENELNDEALHKAFQRVRDKFKGYKELQESFYDVRDGIHSFVQSCVDNVKVVIYMDEVLDQPIIVGVGKQQNRLRITIKSNGSVTYDWTKETWAKVCRDAWNSVTSVIQRILTFIVSKASNLLSLAKSVLPAIGF